jgi:hypothetical protein
MSERVQKRGQVLVLFALAVVVLIGLAGLGVDIGYWYSVRHELQRCADAGALAGASYFKETGYWSSTPGDPNMAIAESRARMLASRDKVLTSPLDNTEIFVSFPENLKIRVGTERIVNLFFSRFFLGPTKTIKAYAIAEAYPVTEKVTCVVPFGIPAPWDDADGDRSYDVGENFSWPAPDSVQCEQVGGVTRWDYATHDVVPGTKSLRDGKLCQGSLQVLKIGSAQNIPPDGARGNFYGMDFADIVNSCPDMDPNHGASFFSYMIKNSCECDFKINIDDEIPPIDTEPGNMVGPTIGPVAPDKYYGVPNPEVDYYMIDDKGKKVYLPGQPDPESLMNGDPESEWVYDEKGGYPNSDSYGWSKDGKYGAGNWKDSPRVIRIPIYDPTGTIGDGIHTPGKNGKTSFQPLGFVGFWIADIQYEDNNNGTVVGRFITVGGWGGSGPEPGPTGTPVLNIRLVE